MSRVGVIAAAGNGRRTGLSEYTSKAALPLAGRSLLWHNVDFLRRSGVSRVIVIGLCRHEALLRQVAGDGVEILVAEPDLGWAGTLASAEPHVEGTDELLLISCDNYHTIERAVDLGEQDAIFTYTRRERGSMSVTDGPVFGCGVDGKWSERGSDHVGDVFTGYVVARAGVAFAALRDLKVSSRGEREITGLLATLVRTCAVEAVPYGGPYVDIADLSALARQDLRLRGLDCEGDVVMGAGVILHDDKGHVLLTERQDGLGWVMPGGLVDPGESFVSAAVREVREEVGVDVVESDLRLLGVYPTIGKGGRPACSVIFRAGILVDAKVRLEPREAASYRMFDSDDAATIEIPFDLRVAVDDHFAGRELDARPRMK